eukprot:5060316-Pyramimonas_sp.AAC.1
MKQLIGSIKDSSTRIQTLEQNFAQEVQSLQQAISTTDKNVHLLNTRIPNIEVASSASTTEAVSVAVELKLANIDAAITGLQSEPTPRPSTQRRNEISGSVLEVKPEAFERAHRAII